MKVKVRWKYSYTEVDTFEEVVEVPDGLDEDAATEAAWEAAQAVPNGDLKVRDRSYPGDPCDELLGTELVDSSEPARIRWREDDDQELRP